MYLVYGVCCSNGRKRRGAVTLRPCSSTAAKERKLPACLLLWPEVVASKRECAEETPTISPCLINITAMSRFKKTDKVDFLAGFRTEKPEPAVPSGLLKAARKSGHLNLSGRGLTEGIVFYVHCCDLNFLDVLLMAGCEFTETLRDFERCSLTP